MEIHQSTSSLTGNLLAGLMEQLQLEIGISSPVLEASFMQYGFLSMNTWLKSLWQFVSEKGIILRDEDPAVPPLQCASHYHSKECHMKSHCNNNT